MKAAPRVVLITGTSSGLGRALAEECVARGDRVYGTVRARSMLPPPGVAPVIADVDDDSSVDTCVRAVLDAAGRIDVLVNNAGFGLAGPVEETPLEDARAIVETNLLGVHRMCRAVLPVMRERGSGHIVNVGSLAGRVGLPFQALYSATKFALAGYSESLKLEVAPFGVRVSLVEPGDYATGFTRRRRLVCDRADSPYRERYRRALSATVAAETRNQDLRPFVAAVLRAVGRPTARLRYPCAGVPERLYVALRPLLPQAVAERLLLNATGLGD